MNPRVITTIDQGIAHVRLNRPDKRNGLDIDMFKAIIEAGESLITNPHVRAVVLSGEGKAFCAGLDFMSFIQGGSEAQETLLQRSPSSLANTAQRVSWIWQEIPVPVIAAVHGVAFGGGLQIALGADIRIVAPDATLSVMEIAYGLIPDMGITQYLLDLVSSDVARDLIFTGRKISGHEAHTLGLATYLDPDPLTAAMEKAKQIAARSPHAIRAAKKLLQRAKNQPPKDALLYETELQIPLLGSKNQLEAVQAMFRKRTPTFEDPTD